MALDLVLRWIHILSAVILLGGTFFLRFSLLPALSSLPDQVRPSFLSAWRPSWSRTVMITSGLLLVSGLVNAVLNIQRYDFEGGLYHGLVAVKLLLALAVFWISSALAGRSSLAERLREKLSLWLSINVVLAVLLVCLAGYMRACPRAAKQEPPVPATSSLDARNLPQAPHSEGEQWTRRLKRSWKC